MNKKFFLVSLVILLGLALTIEYKGAVIKVKDTLVGARVTNRNVSEDAIVVGSQTASGSSGTYIGEFVSTGTVSLNFQGTSSDKETCIQLQNTTGKPVFFRIVGTTVTVNSLECRN